MKKSLRVVVCGLLSVVLSAALFGCQTPAQGEPKLQPLQTISAESFVNAVTANFAKKTSFTMGLSYKGRLAPDGEYAGRNTNLAFSKADGVWNSLAEWVGFTGEEETERGKEYTLGDLSIRADYNLFTSEYQTYSAGLTQPTDIDRLVETIAGLSAYATGDVPPNADDRGYTLEIDIDLKTPFDAFVSSLKEGKKLKFADAMIALWFGEDKTGKNADDLLGEIDRAFADDATLKTVTDGLDRLLAATGTELTLGKLTDGICLEAGMTAQTLYYAFTANMVVGTQSPKAGETPYAYVMRCFGDQKAADAIDTALKLAGGQTGGGAGLQILGLIRGFVNDLVGRNASVTDAYDALAVRLSEMLSGAFGFELPAFDSAYLASLEVTAARATVTVKTDRTLNLSAVGGEALLDVKAGPDKTPLVYFEGEAAATFGYEPVAVTQPADKPIRACFLGGSDHEIADPADFALTVYPGSVDPASLTIEYTLTGVSTLKPEGGRDYYHPESGGLPDLPAGLFLIKDGKLVVSDDFAAKTAAYAAGLPLEETVCFDFVVDLKAGGETAASLNVAFAADMA